MRVLAAPKKYPDELRERATRMAVEARRSAPARSAKQLGTNPETLRNWVTHAEIDGGVRPGTTPDDAQRFIELKRENRELRRANEFLKAASALFAKAERDRRLKWSSTTSTNQGALRGVFKGAFDYLRRFSWRRVLSWMPANAAVPAGEGSIAA